MAINPELRRTYVAETDDHDDVMRGFLRQHGRSYTARERGVLNEKPQDLETAHEAYEAQKRAESEYIGFPSIRSLTTTSKEPKIGLVIPVEPISNGQRVIYVDANKAREVRVREMGTIKRMKVEEEARVQVELKKKVGHEKKSTMLFEPSELPNPTLKRLRSLIKNAFQPLSGEEEKQVTTAWVNGLAGGMTALALTKF